MNTRNFIVGLGVVFVILSVVCGIIDDIHQKKGFVGFCASLALPLGILAILWASRGKPKKPRVSVANIEELLLTAGRAFPLVAIHREQIDPSVCWIGRILGVGQGRVSLLEIDAGAVWDDKPNIYRLNEITRVNFGGDYENALHLVAGDPGHQTKRKSPLPTSRKLI